jgi:uncharacterized protein (TIGR02453 family)
MLAAIAFLRQLERHNDRAWFAERKERYRRDVLEPLQRFVVAVSDECARRRIPLYGDVRRSIFRVYRDVRFTADKRPFKTYAAAYLSRDGGRETQGGLYVAFSPQGSRLAVAFYAPPPPLLHRWRAAIARDPARFARVLAALRAKRLHVRPPEEWDDALRRMPRGFEAHAGTKIAPYLRLRSFAVGRDLTQREVASPRLATIAVDFVEAARPFLHYGWALEAQD